MTAPERRGSSVTRALMAVVLVLLVLVANLYIILLPKYLQMYEDLQVKPPTPTAYVALAVRSVWLKPLVALLAVGVGAAAVVVGLHDGRRTGALIVLAVVLSLLLIVGVVSMFYPIYSMVTDVGAGP